MATWLPRDQKRAQKEEGGQGGGGGGWKSESEGEISSLRRMRDRLGWRKGGGEGVDKGRRQARFLIKADHSQQL